ncbi:hypothetical protein [Novosphingobium resinovorum]|uniref:hypothetical protein n=1 Tax=Novosphingobium resinovorum TaxID=158500 RepID=UPI002ED5CE8A|nr:hypothetical protein [Novosphingobium resinovorum]
MLDFGADDPEMLHVSTGGNAQVPGAAAVLRLPVAVPRLAGPLTRLAVLARLGLRHDPH